MSITRYAVNRLIAMIPIGLGMLIMVPVMMGSVYASYVEIFE